MAEGIVKRHSKGCPARAGKRCKCNAGYEAFVSSPRDGKKVRKTFARLGEAKSWRVDAKRSVDLGTLRTPTRRTLGEAAGRWLTGAEAGDMRNRSGQPYKPATLRGFRQALDTYLLPVLGGRKLNTVTTADLQELVDRWQAEGQSAWTIRNWIKAIYRRARSREGLPVNPTHDLELPAPAPREVEIIAPEIAAQMLEAAPAQDRALWATAFTPACVTASFAPSAGARSTSPGGRFASASPGTRRRARSRQRPGPPSGQRRCRVSCGIT
jgi:hypothetical protein